MSRKNIENIHSLSPMAQGILFHTLYDGTPGVYQVELAWTLRGKLDVAALGRAWQEVVDRHQALRTAFVWERLEKPMAVVRRRVAVAIEEVDLSGLPPEEREARAAEFQEELGKRGFDLTRAPLMRLALVRLGPELHKLIWSSHHLLLDGWSLPLVVREAFALYAAHAAGRPIQLEQPRPYGDYIAWLTKQDLGKAEQFWRRELAGFGVPTPLRGERLAPAPGEEGFEERTHIIGAAEAGALQAFARNHKLTMSTLVQGAWALLLARYSGEEEILYGSTVSGRTAPVAGIDRMVGLFINTLPVRVPVPRGAPALAWLQRLQDRQSELREYEYSPLIQIQGWSELPRGVALFESQVAFENYPSTETLLQASGGLEVAATEMASQAHYPLTFVAVSQRTVGLRISYDRRRFERATIDRMLQHLAALLGAIAREPERDVWQLPMLTEEERRQLVFAWNETPEPFSPAECAHRLFERCVDRRPEAPALVAKDGRLTYAELDERANRLAHHLRRLGVGRDLPVGLYLDRSAETVVAILAILKAGGAYVPLDPSHPPHRIAQIRDEAGIRVVVSRASLAAGAEGEGITVVRVDDDAAAIAAESGSRPEGGATPDSLAYVLFTSGSTGQPKGVAVEHRNLVNYTLGIAGRLGLPEGASYAHVSTFAADVGITVLFPPLCLGGVMHVIPEDLTTDPDALGDYFAREGIDCLKIVPSHFSALLSGGRPERVVPRRLLVVGGEGLRWELVERVHALSPGTRVLNHYAPTECTCGVLTHAADAEIAGLPIAPLGRPLPNSQAYVLDRHLAPVPVGVPGEIFIGGAAVTRGYLGRPDLTAERFLADPFRPGGRIYRSGDRGRQLADGTIVFLGRVDFQVKIRGYRIELGEVEAALLSHPGVREGVVLAVDDESGDKHLCAYAVPRPEALPTVEDLHAFLAQRLPDYMVPGAYHVLSALPLTPNGKIDRKALSELEVERHGQAEVDAYVAPRTPIEDVLCGIWADVIGRERIGVHDKFADLGGHSLLAIQIIARAREAFKVDVPLRAIFEAPTVAGLALEVEAALRKLEGGLPAEIERVSRDGDLALSFGQERLWFLHQLDPASPSFNVASQLRLSGKLDADALGRALRDIVRRHEILRTIYRAVDGKPVQVILADLEVPFSVVELSDRPAEEREQAARAEAAAEAQRPFDLSTGPLFRARLLRLAEEEHVLLLTLHHIVSDGSTRAIIGRELSVLYRGYLAGETPILPELPLQYADYAAWQRRWLSGEALDRQIAYWKKQLEGAPQAIELPTDHPRPPVLSDRGAHRQRIFSAELGKALKDLARREGVTLYMVLLSAIDVLLHRWTGQRDVVIGTSVTNRSRPEIEGLIGFFINALVLRTEVDDAVPFTALLKRVREVCLGAYAHQDMPFERLVQELSPDPDPSRTPLFQTIFTLQNAPGAPLELPGLTVKSGGRGDVTSVKYDLIFLMGEGSKGELGVSLDYNSDLFEGATIERMIGHLGILLEGIVQDPSRKVAELPMLPAEERQQLLVGWNDTAPSYSTDDCVHELFEAQADATPDAPAVISGRVRLSYRELDARANQVARRLAALGVGPESVVGICHGRSVGIVVGILGILKAGAAYVPLDPAFPPHRLAQLVTESGARVVVTEEALAPSLPTEGVTLLRLDTDARALAAESEARLAVGLSSANIVYVLFTSGSTGRPKGVAVEHRNLVNYIHGIATRLELPPGSSYAHVSTFSADLGNTVLFPPLCLGGTVHVVPEDLTTDPVGLGAYFEEHRIDCLKIAPSHFTALLSTAHGARVIPSKLLVVGGEGLKWELAERVRELSPGTRVLNHYSPTECTCGVLTYAVGEGPHPETPIAPLGRPLPGSRIYVLDPLMAPVPMGAAGEVYIGGAGVTRGYLGQPDLTRERFLPDPFTPGGRIYRSGDRARYLPDGNLVFLGRLDFQVKIRGYRVELGEVEAALGSHPGVSDVVVLALDDPFGHKRLVAYVTTAPGAAVTTAELQAFMEARLPEYMVPAAYQVLDAFPLNANGKADRQALAALDVAQEEGGKHVGPRTPVEEVLETIWCDVFEREQIGVHERFNEIGGHSLLAIQIIARARDAFDVQLPLRTIFETPTIATLAERVELAVREGAGEDAPPPLERAAREGTVPLSFAQERLWFLDQLDPGSTAYHIPVRTRLTGELDVAAFERSLQEILRRHEVLRTTYGTVDGKPHQVIRDDVTFRLPVEDAVGRPEAVPAAVAAEMAAPFDLAEGPLVRGRLLRLGPTDHVLLLTFHHIVADGWTKGVLFRELSVLYEAFRAGRPSPLEELPVQYADFAIWQRGWLSGETLDRQLSYWKEKLGDAPASLDLPTDRPRPPVLAARGARRQFQIPLAVSKALKELSRREGATLFMTLLAAFDVLLHRYSGQSDIVVGSPTAGRTRPEIEPLIGFFVNTLVLRAKLEPEMSFLELLGRVREACLGAYAHADVPFERLVADLAPERDLSRTPLFQVAFTVQDAPGDALRLPSLVLSGVAAETVTSKFDLTLGLGDSPRGILGSFEYNAELFDATTADRMMEHFRVLLEGVVADPTAPISSLPLMSAAEREKLLVSWNPGADAHAPGACIHERFEAQVDARPEAVALTFDGRSLSYGEVELRANRIAHRLRALGVGPEVLVGLAVERSAEMIVALLGILKAGGAYLPLDPEYPAERLAFMLQDAKVPVVITDAAGARKLPEGLSAAVVRLDADADALAAEPATRPASGVGPTSLAYVIYTSGSTGKPKGAMVTHHNVVRLFQATDAWYRFDASDVWTMFHSHAFDFSVWEIWGALFHGGRLVVVPYWVSRAPETFYRLLADEGVTVLNQTPSAFRQLVHAEEQALPSDVARLRLRYVVFGGEALDLEDLRPWWARHGDAAPQLVNMYGITETTVHVTYRPVGLADLARPWSSVIGRAIPDLTIYVLDAAREPAPTGVPGELYVGGAGVARGYLDRPELTAERFLDDPFRPGGRLYKTGDLARWLPNGDIEYLGRIDHQVKIRGFRIELGEIESVLGQHPAVRECVVLARQDGPGDKRLVAYLVPTSADAAPTVNDLRAFARQKLPDMMVPAAFMLLDALPLTENGKIDRRALPAPEEGERLSLGEEFVSPRSATEEALARIWAAVLRLERVGVHDNFFAIGGDSILSIQIVSRALAAGIRLSPRQLFQHQTIAELAAVAGAEGAVAAEQGPVTGPAPLTPIQRWWLEQAQPQADHNNQSYFLATREALEPSHVEAALAVLLGHHDALRLRVVDRAQTFAEPGGAAPLRHVDLRGMADAERAAAVERAAGEAQRSLDVAAGPVLRAVLFRGDEGSRLLLVVHHLAVDAVSWRVLVEDLWSSIQALRAGVQPTLPAKTTSYRRWAERLEERAASAELAGEARYWLDERRAAARPVPVDHATGENTEGSAASVVVSFSPDETEALLRRVPDAYRTQINDALLAALSQALVSWTGAPVLIDLEGHGREDLFADVDLTRTVGWFTAIFPVLLDPGSAEPGEALKAVKEQLRAVPGRGVGYGLLRYLRRGDDLGARLAALPQAEISFNYLGQLDGAAEVGDAPYTRARESAGAAHGPENRRAHLLDVHGSVLGGRLHVRFTFSKNRHERATIEGLADRFQGALRALVQHCVTAPGGYTPADFPRAALAQPVVDAIAARFPGRGAVEDIHPLSPLQAGILFHALYDTGPGSYYVQLAWTIEGALDVAAFERAWRDVSQRHQVLRTAVLWEGLDSPLAVVLAAAAPPFVEHDLRALSPEERAREVERFVVEDRRRGFDLASAPLMRVTLLRLSDAAWRFVWGSHHIILDGWSMPILLKEVFQLYEAHAAGREARLDVAPAYRAYVDWLVAQDPGRAAAFWAAQLGGFSSPTPLPDGGGRGTGFGERRVRLSAAESETLSSFARRHQLTVNTIVQGAWALLLSRYSGEDDVVFGSTVSGRSAPVPGIDRMVGLFINTLAVRARVLPGATALSFLSALQAQQAELREHEHSGLVEVQSASAVPRGTPLFESLVVFENQPVEESLRRGAFGLSLTEARAVERPPYPLTLQGSFRKDLLLRLGFDASRFDEALMERALGHLTTLLAAIVASPDAPLSSLPILSAAEREQLAAWNDTAFAHPTDRLIHELVADQAARTPDAIALSFEGRDLTYGEFDARANQLAHALRRRGVGPDVLVGVCMDRSLEMLVALHGVLRAGGAYVPLDPEYPKDRLGFMLEDARPRVILTQAHVAAALPSHGAEVLTLDPTFAILAGEPTQSPGRGELGLGSLAYVIYTSGSTGRPKGAMNEHRGILNRLLWMQHAYGLTASDRVFQKTPFSFDVSVWELFWPLMFGARLVIARPGGHREPRYLVDTIAAAGVTTMHFVPSMLQVFLDDEHVARASSLTRVFASGEALLPPLVDRFFARLPGARLHNLYGPTEAAVDVTSWECRPGATVVPIGKPVHNTAIHLLDAQLSPVPEGIRGELYIGGVQVGRGYLNRAELTAERFLDDPSSPGARLYKTGDVARRLPSGDIEYLGRADFQVKLRGFRIELGEIEADLLGHPTIREVVVVAREEGAGERRLVAYLVPGEGPRPTAGELRGFLKEKLPEYMVPAAFVWLDRLPLTASGKIDRRALPAPEEGERAETGSAYAAPSSAVEEELSRIWMAVLRLSKVSVHDNYFEVGGDSILSIQIVARAQKAGIRLTPRQIFEHPTIAELAAVAGTAREVVAEQGPVTGEVPWTPVERWWLEVPRIDAHHWNQSTFVEVRELLDPALLERALARVLEHHDALRLRIADLGGARRQAIAPPGGTAPLRVVDLGGVPAEERRALVERAGAEAHASLDLAEGPLVRAVLFTAEAHRLLVVAHHVVVDGVSWRILLDDLWTAYEQLRRGGAPALPAKTTSWKRWAERLAEHARSEAMIEEAAFWLARPPALAARLPRDLARGDNDEASARNVLVSLGAEDTDRLLREVHDAYRTQINDLLLTALTQALAPWTGAPGAVFDFEGHGREPLFDDVDITRTVGWFTTVYPVALELPDAAAPGAAIKAVKEQLRAIPGRGIGHGLLRYLRDDAVAADLARQQSPEICWNYLGQADQALPEDAPFRWAEGSTGLPRSPRGARRYLLDINARVVQGKLHVWFGYSQTCHHAETIEALADRFLRALRALIEHCLSPEARGLTPSDFAESNLSQDVIDMLVGEIDGDLEG